MRIRLIQPPLVQPRYRQLTLPVVGAELAARGFEVEACDENVEDLDLSPVDLVGITCHVYNAPRAFEIARLFRERGTQVLMGGTFPTIAPELVAPHCDGVVVGELEALSSEIARDARAGRLRRVYRASAPPSLQSTVEPDLSLTPSDRYFRFNFPLELSRGCRFACRFCTARTLYSAPRVRSIQDVERDLGNYDHGLGGVPAAGQLLPISQNAALFSLLGTTYGGDGLTTFALPDLRSAAPNGLTYVICVTGVFPSRT